MTILFGAVQGVAAIKAEALSIHNAKTPRYYLRAGNMYLHQSGARLQDTHQYAWTGTIEQAAAMRRTFSAAAGCKIAAVSDIPQHSDLEA
jgi:hypothetical protein